MFLCFGSHPALSQGQVNFANFATGVNAPVTNIIDGTRVTGPAFAAQLFYAAPGSGNNIDSYTPVAGVVPFQTGAGAGYFLGGSKTIPGFGNGVQLSLITAAFATAAGADFLSARAAGGPTSYGRPILVTVTTAPAPPPNMTSQQSYGIVPEPSLSGLLAVGAMALITARQRRK